MKITQFEDKELSHFSYALLSGKEMMVIDPSRDPQQYYDFAKSKDAKIVGIIETHSHADFVSSHLEIHNKTGAPIYASKMLDAQYPSKTFDQDASIKMGQVTLKAINTPGHSFDSICIIAFAENEKPEAIFTGDTLLLGDCGRPDLRDNKSSNSKIKSELVEHMYHSLRHKLSILPDDVVVYPAHGAGSLCAKSMSDAKSSTIGHEKKKNWSLQEMTLETFTDKLLKDQSFIPKYFQFDVAENKKGAEEFKAGISHVKTADLLDEDFLKTLDSTMLIIDGRPGKEYKKSHLKGSVNLMHEGKFETWLGSIVNPREPWESYLSISCKRLSERI